MMVHPLEAPVVLPDTLNFGLIGAALLVLLLLALIAKSTVYIPNNRVGIVEKLISGRGSLKTGFIALAGEAGFQPEIVRGGWHFFAPFQYRIHKMPLVTIPQGKIGYVFARDGQDLPATQTIASNASANNFQDVPGFLRNGGQKGPQRMILREGTYAINLAQFVVITEDHMFYLPLDKSEEVTFQKMLSIIQDRKGFQPVIIKGNDDAVGIVTVHDGHSLSDGEIIAPIVGGDPKAGAFYHNNFQDADKFLAAGGQRGRQLQVLVDGTYYINRLFATVELIPKTVVEVGYVAVVVSYTGNKGQDISGAGFAHGELVAKGERGVWADPLLPGKYAFNTYAGKVVMVPTTNFILKWVKNEKGSHSLDENLSEVSLITKDAFEPNLPLQVVVHIDYRNAPLVIQRFGDVKQLVEQTLDPMVSAFFKNIGQTRTIIELIQQRSQIQEQSHAEMREKFLLYNLELQEVLLGTPTSGEPGGPIETILTQLRSRQLADEQVTTYARQQSAAVKQRELREAEATAEQQTKLTQSAIAIEVQSNEGKAALARAQQEATQITTIASAEAEKLRIMGEGEAKRIKVMAEANADQTARVGIAQAVAIEEQVRASGGAQFQMTRQVMERFAQAVENSKVDVVPKINMGGGGNLLVDLLTLLMSGKAAEMTGVQTGMEPSAEVKALRQAILSAMGKPGDLH
jgi:uncharacterized membrane protein YqiK